ncbi:MAG TPA: hypothetical protein VIH21_08495, partial [Dehalococcoidia bacterium]
MPDTDEVRSFATMLRDNVPMPRDVLDRLVAVEANRHPTQTQLRMALGLDLDLNPANDAARRAAWRPGAVPSDDDLARMIDAMYAAITSSRLVRVEIDANGTHASRDAGPIRVREGEHLKLLILAHNTTDEGVEFSAESHGEGLGGWVEPHRSGSALLDCAAMPRGSFLLPVLIAAAGRTTTIDIPIECDPSGTLHLTIVGDATGEAALAARVTLVDGVGPAAPEDTPLRADVHDNPWFHMAGAFDARVSGRTRIRVARGIEYEPFETTIDMPPDGDISVEARLHRWSHMAADGWYSGDVHVHLHYGGEYLLTPEDASLAQHAEDVNFMNMMVANQGTFWVHDRDHFTGRDNELSDGTHILRWGEEYRNNFYGHMCMFGINELVPPIYSGFRESEHTHDLP